MQPGSRAFRLLEIVTVGLPFCAFKILTGQVLTSFVHVRPLGWMLIALGCVDLLLNVVALALVMLRRRSGLPVCTAQWLATRARPGNRAWRQLGLSVDTMLAFTLVAVVIGLGWIPRLSSSAVHVWSMSVVLNVLGAGLGRLAESVGHLGENERHLTG